MRKVRFPGLPDLTFVLAGREDVGFPKTFEVCAGIVVEDLLLQVLVTDHGACSRYCNTLAVR
jgi:hypothetical protein